MKRVRIDLDDYPIYSLYISLEGVLYKIRLYFNERMQSWIMDLYHGDESPIVLGQRLTPNYPLFLNYTIEDLSGYFLLSPKGQYKNKTIEDPYQIKKYYDFFYYYEDEEEE